MEDWKTKFGGEDRFPDVEWHVRQSKSIGYRTPCLEELPAKAPWMEPFLNAFYTLLSTTGQEFSYVDIRELHSDLYFKIDFEFFIGVMCDMRNAYCSNFQKRMKADRENKRD